MLPHPYPKIPCYEETECFDRGQQDCDVCRESVGEVLSEEVALGDLKDEKEPAMQKDRGGGASGEYSRQK